MLTQQAMAAPIIAAPMQRSDVFDFAGARTELEKSYKRLWKIDVQLDANKKLNRDGRPQGAILSVDAREKLTEKQSCLLNKVADLRSAITVNAINVHTVASNQDLLDAVDERVSHS